MRLLAALLTLLPLAAQAQVPVVFQVDMSYQIQLGQFDPEDDFVDVAGSFNNWGSELTPLSDADDDSLYTVSVGGFSVGQTFEYKFRLDGVWDDREEFPGAGNNREHTVETQADTIRVWYNDEAPPVGPPVADFSASTQQTSPGGLVFFEDRSAGDVNAWHWTFEGGTPATSTERDPAVRYDAPGLYDVTLVARDPDDGEADTLFVPDAIEVAPHDKSQLAWWNDTVFYEVFVRSFYDSDGDGIGDLDGLTEKLDYLNDGDPETTDDLGVTGLWLMPISESPSYHGYDVTDYRSIERDYGTMEDFRAFLDAAHERGIRVVVDYVMNHSSSEHPWFEQSAAGDPFYRDFYRWSDTDPGGWHYRGGDYYYGYFWSEMPDLNYETEAVQDSMFAAATFWLDDVGVDGFRLDAVKFIFEEGSVIENLPETHQFWGDFNEHVESVREDAMLVGEAWTNTSDILPYITNDRLDYAFEFDLASAIVNAAYSGDASGLVGQAQRVYDLYPHLQWGSFLTNHDQDRVMDVLERDPDRVKTAAALLLTLPGVPYLYYGEEIGMLGTKPDPEIRRPMQWSDAQHGGFTTGSPWMALSSNYAAWNVEDQQDDPTSLLSWYQQLIGLRNEEAALRRGTYASAPSSDDAVMAFVREHDGETLLVAINTSDASVETDLSLPPDLLGGASYVLPDLLADGDFARVDVAANGLLTDLTLAPHGAHVFKLSSARVGIDETSEQDGAFLFPAAPNPASGTARLTFRVPQAGPATLVVHDVLGREVDRLVDAPVAAGTHHAILDADALASGVYLFTLRAGGFAQTRTLTVVR